MAASPTIERDNKLPRAQDYGFLSKEAISLIQSLSGEIWTDYNTHDPGITLLETICYALTDLGYRTSFDIADILASKDKSKNAWSKEFYTAAHILPVNPLTLLDYRKLVIDTEGVRNAWIEKSEDYEISIFVRKLESSTADKQRYELTYDADKGQEIVRLRGLYKVFVEYEDTILKQKKEEKIADTIRKKLQANRNLCEDFISVTSIEYETFPIEAIIQVNEGSDIDLVTAKIYKVIHDFFSPPITFYSLEQMMEKYGSADQIFSGPALKYGFIDSEELEKSERYKNVHLSDIIQLIAGVEGVIAVKRFAFEKSRSPYNDFSEWVNNVTDMQKAPRLDIENSKITFVRSGDRHREDKSKEANKERVLALFAFLQSGDFRSRLKGISKDIPVPAGEFMEIADYYPFQNNLPLAYGMAEKYLDDSVDLVTVNRAVAELLDHKAGVSLRQVFTHYLAEAENDHPFVTALNTLLVSRWSEDGEVEDTVDALLKDKAGHAILTQILEKLFGVPVKAAELKDTLYKLIQPNQYQSGASEKSKILAALGSQTEKKTLLLITETSDLDELKKLYRQNQLKSLAKPKRVALQLRGFLMVFEQIMADYLSKLSHTREIFSFDRNLHQTNFPEILDEIKDVEALFINFKKYKDSQLRLAETNEEYINSRNSMLDHLMSRFSESMDKYAYFMKNYLPKTAGKRLIADKIAFLLDYEQISAFRGRAFDYTTENGGWNSDNVEGLKKRIARLVGIEHYERKTIATESLFIKEIALDNDGNKRYVAILSDSKDPGSDDAILLQSIQYEDIGEARQILTYILEEGMDSSLYMEEKRKDRHKFQLKRRTQENDFEVVAESREFHNKEDRENALKKTLQVLNGFTNDENFHIIEHMLLRPKIGAREPVTRRRSSGADQDEVNLLSVRNVPERVTLSANKPKESDLEFHISQEKRSGKDDIVTWKLSLIDEDDEVLIVPEPFTFFRHLSRRIKHIREFGSDVSSYVINTKADGLFAFKIKGPDRDLAEGRRGYRKKEELDAAIARLVNFFSYEPEHPIGDQNEDTLGYHADPYSLQISVVIPNWQKRFRSPSFMHLLEKTIYMETPSHIHPHIYWLDHKNMQEFEEAYKLWVEELHGIELPDTDIVNKMIMALNELRKV